MRSVRNLSFLLFIAVLYAIPTSAFGFCDDPDNVSGFSDTGATPSEANEHCRTKGAEVCPDKCLTLCGTNWHYYGVKYCFNAEPEEGEGYVSYGACKCVYITPE